LFQNIPANADISSVNAPMLPSMRQAPPASRPSDHLVRSVRESITSNASRRSRRDPYRRRDQYRQREETADVQDTRSCFCLRHGGIILGVVRRPVLPDLVSRCATCGAGGDARGRRMRHRLSPRPLWRLPAERGRRDRAGGPGAPGGGAARRRRTARRLRGGIPLAPAVPALRHPLIACQFRPANAAASRSRLPRSCGTRIVGLIAHRRGVTRLNHGSCAVLAKARSRQGSIKARLTRETSR
jgi:hypothetical protein